MVRTNAWRGRNSLSARSRRRYSIGRRCRVSRLVITAGGSGEQILGDDGLDVCAFCHIGASADGAAVEGDALDHGVDPLPVGEL